jgi:alpha-tubulin suppressor-like RCC1 family protein
MLTEKANALIAAGNLTELQIAQLTAIQKFTVNSKYVVANIAALPDAAANEGRLVYVVSEEDFYFSRGEDWTTVFDSTVGVLSSDMFGWGNNGIGQLGVGGGIEVARISSPIQSLGGINWNKISATNNGKSVLMITYDGVGYGVGYNSFGLLGLGDTQSKNSPVTMVGNLLWNKLSVGSQTSFGITQGGILYGWGFNSGRLGDGTGSTISASSPVTVVGGITSWTDIAAGIATRVGIAGGVAYAWGVNTSGQVGDGTVIARSSPVTVVGGITNWKQVSAGGGFSIGITETGVGYAWGSGTVGKLGNNSLTNQSSPVTISGGITWNTISAGYGHSLGISSSGIAYAWGLNSAGRLGDGTVTSRVVPVTVVGGITNWSQVSGGKSHSLGLTSSGIVYAWGNNGSGQLGTNSISNTSSPVTVVGGVTNWSQVSGGGDFSIALNTIIKGFNEP